MNAFIILSRVFLALAEDVKDRGTIVAHGGGKVKGHRPNTNPADTSVDLILCEINIIHCYVQQALIPLALEGTDKGKIKASHALAKIAAVSNPEIAFPGERVRQTFVPLL